MGFDLYGTAARSEVGRYFGSNNAGWYPLARLCLQIAPDICAPCEHRYWYSNDGYGLDDAGAKALGDVLQRTIDSGALKYEDALSGQESEVARRVFIGLELGDGRSLALVAPNMV